MKNVRIFHLKTFIFLVVKFSVYLNRLVLVMGFAIFISQVPAVPTRLPMKTSTNGAHDIVSTRTCLHQLEPISYSFRTFPLCTRNHENMPI